MTNRELNSVKTALAHFKTACAAGGNYCPSVAQMNALKSLWGETTGLIGKRDATRFEKLLTSINNAYSNEVYCVDFSEAQIAAIEKALAKAE